MGLGPLVGLAVSFAMARHVAGKENRPRNPIMSAQCCCEAVMQLWISDGSVSREEGKWSRRWLDSASLGGVAGDAGSGSASGGTLGGAAGMTWVAESAL
jgi:hypothetical protein